MISRNGLLVVSFGTTSPESRLLNIDPVEQAIEDSLSDDWSVNRCFSSQFIINAINREKESG